MTIKLNGNARVSFGSGCSIAPREESLTPALPCVVCNEPTKMRCKLGQHSKIKFANKILTLKDFTSYKTDTNGEYCICFECMKDIST